ncbi:MAG: right-handed parallel beta-helix repeat-containing protein [Terrimicrobiaceae bacterium]
MRSQEAPYKTVTAATQLLGPGDRVLIAPGIYRETVGLSGAGTKENPVVIESEDPANPAILSGADAITDWKPLAGSPLPEANHPHAGDIFYAEIDWEPGQLFFGAHQQKIARVPVTGWFSVSSTDGQTVNSDQLAAIPAEDLTGAEIFYFLAKGVVQTLAPVKGWSQKGSALEIERPLFKENFATFTEADRFYLQNHSSFLTQPGKWIHQQTENGTRLFWWPPTKEALALAEAPRREEVVSLGGSSHVVLRGLQVRHGAAGPSGFGIGGIESKGSVEAGKGLIIDSCAIYQNQRFGLNLKGLRDGIIRRCLIVDNSYGATISNARNVLVEENQIAWNLNDGLVVAWDAEDIVVRKNAIHHHSRFAHPDNIQTYRGVKNYLLDSNVLIASGQNAHTQQTVDFIARNNIIAGASANSFFTSQSQPDSKNTGTEKEGGGYLIENNTFTLNANGAIPISGAGHKFQGNIFDIRGGKYAYGGKIIPSELTSTNNLFWQTEARHAHLAALTGEGRKVFNVLEDFQAAGLEEGSVYEDPRFAKVPLSVIPLDGKNIASNTESRLYFEGNNPFAVGDHVEYDFDGVDRVVRETDGQSIIIDPPLPHAPITTVLLIKWGDQPVGPMDFTTKSPHGSKINFEATMRADFDNDGKRDVPGWPEGIQSPRRVFQP